MDVKQLIDALSKVEDKTKIVILADSDNIGWDNIGSVIEETSQVTISMDGNHIFEN